MSARLKVLGIIRFTAEPPVVARRFEECSDIKVIWLPENTTNLARALRSRGRHHGDQLPVPRLTDDGFCVCNARAELWTPIKVPVTKVPLPVILVMRHDHHLAGLVRDHDPYV